MNKQLKNTNRIATITLTVLISALIIGTTGCSNNASRLESNQLKLQKMIETNSEQMAAIAVQLDRNRRDIDRSISNLRNDTRKLSEELTAARKQIKNTRELAEQLNSRINSVAGTQERMIAEQQTKTQVQQKRLDTLSHQQVQSAQRLNQLQERLITVSDSVAVLQKGIAGLRQSFALSIDSLNRIVRNRTDEQIKSQQEFRRNVAEKFERIFESLISIEQFQSKLASVENQLNTTRPANDYSLANNYKAVKPVGK